MKALNPKRGNPYTYEHDAFNRRYIDEIEAHHKDNFDHVFSTRAKVYKVPDRDTARKFVMQSILSGLRDCGVDVFPWMDEIDLTALAAAKGLSLEFKNKPAYFDNYDPKEDYKRLGYYIYKHNEIAHFVSCPHEIKRQASPSGVILIGNTGQWLVWSTIDPQNQTVIAPS